MRKITKDEYIHGGTQLDYYDESKRTEWNCPLCQKNEYIKIDDERGLSIVKCKHCDLIYTNPHAINTNENYFGETDTFYNEAHLVFKGILPSHRDRNYLYELKKIKKFKKTGKLLDVGSNMGLFLRLAVKEGFDAEGVEPSPSLAKIAKDAFGLKVHNSFLENAHLPEKSYDIITLIDVFEHVINPAELLNECHRLLKPDGIIAIKVPNGDYNHFKMKLIQKSNGNSRIMDTWNACEHVVHYTPETFKKMVENQGFKIKYSCIPLPIHSPVWANLTGHYFIYPTPFLMNWKRITVRNLFYWTGKLEYLFRKKTGFGPDLMFIIEKKG